MHFPQMPTAHLDPTKASQCARSDCALLVVSCDAYADLWTPFFTLLNSHWPDCPYPVFLGAGKLVMPGINTMHSSGGRDWSLCMIEYLERLDFEYIIVMLDDFFLRKRVVTSAIESALDFARRHNSTMIRLIPRPPPTARIPDSIEIGECAPGSPYRLCMQAAIWRRAKLLSLLRTGESIWQFELNGNERINSEASGYYCTWRHILPYNGIFAHHVVEKGRWFCHEKWIFSRASIGCDFSRRGVLPWRQTVVYHLAAFLDVILSVFSWQTKMRIKRRIKSILAKHFGAMLARLRALE